MNQDIGADCYFHKGKSNHTACQDYALVGDTLAGDTEHVRYGILSDGCSSSPDTDVGARLLPLLAKRLVEMSCAETLSFRSFEEHYTASVISEANKVRATLGLGQQSLDVTLLTLMVTKEWMRVSICGDGYFVIKHADGWLRGVQCVYPGGYPKYPSYMLNAVRSEQRDAQGGPGYSEPFEISPSGELTCKEQTPIVNSYDNIICPIPADAEAAFLFSDGIGQFGRLENKAGSPVDFKNIMIGLTSIKGYAGKFVERRANKFLNKECPENKLVPYDDVSVVGIKLKCEA